VGLVLAQRLGVDFVDTDQVIERNAGKRVGDIFIEDGEQAFRALEQQVVADTIANHTGVIALGGGAVLSDQTRELLANIPTVWLTVSTDSAASRVGLNAARPVLMGNVRGQLTALAKHRAPFYEEVATVTVQTDGLDPSAVADKIVEVLELGGDDA